MSREPIEKFMEPEQPKIVVQAKVPKPLYERVNELREERNWTWPELMEAMFKRLLAEKK